MRRRPRIDLGQPVHSAREASGLDRKRQRWSQVNKGRPDSENPFLAAVKPDHENYGDADETREQLQARLNNLEFGNFPGYFNYRKNAAAPEAKGQQQRRRQEEEKNGDHSSCVGDEPDNQTAAAAAAAAASAGEPAEQPTNSAVHNLVAGISDERLNLMRREWFADKDVLDIGCNRGHVTYAIARLFEPKFILGIDIDLKMIQMANRDLHLHLEDDGGLLRRAAEFRREHAVKLRLESEQLQDKSETDARSEAVYAEDEDQFPLASYIAQGPLALNAPRPFPNNILFVEHNYVLARDELVEKQRAFFDTIVCLSVTKWIHLNYRDDGLKRFFRRIHRHLRPGGLLVLEVQPFDNYGRRKKLSDRLKANFYSIQFKPDQFDEYLLGPEVGFREILSSTTTSHECAGFKRPLKVYLK